MPTAQLLIFLSHISPFIADKTFTEKNGSARITHKLVKKRDTTWLANVTSRLVYVTSTLRIY